MITAVMTAVIITAFAAVIGIIGLAFTMLASNNSVSGSDPADVCPNGSYDPTPTAVNVTTVPISIGSTITAVSHQTGRPTYRQQA